MATADQIAQFKLDNWKHALAVSKATGIDPRIALAQAAVESGWGTAAPGNNYFGVKGPGQELDTTEAGPNGLLVPTKASFKMYDTPEHSWADYAGHPLIVKAGQAGDYKAQLAALKGYATAPNYTDTIDKTAQSLVVPQGVEASTLPQIGSSSAAATPPVQGGLLQGGAGTEPWNDPDINKRIAFSDKEIGEWSKSGADASAGAQTAAGLGAAKIGTQMMMQQPATPKLQMVESANIPQSQGQGNPNFLTQLAQLRLKRQQGGV